MNISKFILSLLFILFVSCRAKKYDYYNLSKLEKKNFKLEINSKEYNLTNTILDKRNISKLIIVRKDKRVMIETFKNPQFKNLKTITDSINDQDLNFTVIYGIPIFKEKFNSILIEKNGIDSLKIVNVTNSCNNSKFLIIKTKE